MTRYVRVPARILHEVPNHLGFESACLTEPCCVAYNAVVKNARIEPGDRVVVLGPERSESSAPRWLDCVAPKSLWLIGSRPPAIGNREAVWL